MRSAPFSYDEVGTSRESAKAPAGYAVDHNRARLGRGRSTFERGVAALYSWKMFDVGWARLVPADGPVEVGTTVAVLARRLQRRFARDSLRAMVRATNPGQAVPRNY